MRIFLFFSIFHFVITEIAYDKAISPKHKSSHGSVSLGQQIPDWSEVTLRGKPKILEILLAVDGPVARYYGNNRDKIRDGVLSLLHGVNQYLHQLQIQLLIVDLRVANGYNLTLEDFKNWREEEEDLPQHDLAMLLRLRYDGGIASVDGVCTREGIGISGFFPEAPHEYASVFVHEVAHLLGLAHDTRVNCRCSSGKKGCLKIEGFDDCSAQALVEMSEKKSCLQETNDHPLSIPMCGNGIVELGEQCDCGPAKHCRNLLCDSQSCQYRLSKEILYLIAFFLFAIIGAIGYCFLRSLCSRLMNITKKSKRKALPNFQPFVVSSVSSQADFKSSVLTNSSTRMLIKTGSEDSASSTAKLLPDFSRNRLNRDSKSRSRRTENLIHLDSEIPIVDPVNHSDYVKMHPAKFHLGSATDQHEYLSPKSTTLPKIRSASLQRGENAQMNRSPIIPLRVAPPPPNQSRRASRSFSHLPGLPASLSASYGEATAAVLRDLRSSRIYDIPASFISQQSFDEPPAIPPKKSLAGLAV
ncbi:unnamed protein product, partial [Mesorhabditis belari]|uniref:Peptidase M12B domain-containing protein n=1 Tax=Mesorhabditis belari TaxID=2138241 RepID=A0AAF3EE93_9BILA